MLLRSMSAFGTKRTSRLHECPLSGVRRITRIFRSRWRMQIEKGVAMPEINTEFLFTIALEIQVSSLGDTPYGGRRIFHFTGGSFEGPKLKGRVLPGGGGCSLIRRDEVLEVDVRLILETDDKHQIYMTWKGLRHGPKEVMERLYRGDIVEPGAYSGSLGANARTLDVFQVL